jgi:hypothetical protein
MRLRQKMTTNAVFVVIFYFSYETRAKDNNELALSFSSFSFSCITEIMMSLPTHRHVQQFKEKKKT